METSAQLTEVRVEGFRSLKNIALKLEPITVVIGPNGAGKSNLLSVLSLIPLMRTQSLRRYVGQHGGASSVLHYGPDSTREIRIELHFRTEAEQWRYVAKLGYAAGDALIFLDEKACHIAAEGQAESSFALGTGHAESKLKEVSTGAQESVVGKVNELVGRMSFFHFHDTSLMAPLRQSAKPADSKYLRSDGSNLAAFLYRLKRSEAGDSRAAWALFEALVRRVAPFIKALEPDLVDPEQPDASSVRLFWTDERDYRFDTHDLSDGALRTIALFAALTQPPASRPMFITIDEPELGLHPAAISIFAALVRSASAHSRILIATQSPALLDEFRPEEVVVAERQAGETTFRRLEEEKLASWLEDYSLSQLYGKNVLGGRP